MSASTSPHTFTCGTSGTGKTTLKVFMSREWMAMRRRGVIVCDPKMDPRWRCDRLVPDSVTMLALARESSRCHLILDESGETVQRYKPEMFWFTTQSRGYPWFHVAHLLAQDPKQVYPQVRHQCGTYNLFPMPHQHYELLGEEMMQPEVAVEGPKLKVEPAVWCEFLRVVKFGGMRKLRLDIQRGTVMEA